jgi:Holliday junction resolvase RusA-like endonuclease
LRKFQRLRRKGEAPWMDLDNLAKALLDSLSGNVFEDDRQVARLLVERREGARDGIWMLAEAMEG